MKNKMDSPKNIFQCLYCTAFNEYKHQEKKEGAISCQSCQKELYYRVSKDNKYGAIFKSKGEHSLKSRIEKLAFTSLFFIVCVLLFLSFLYQKSLFQDEILLLVQTECNHEQSCLSSIEKDLPACFEEHYSFGQKRLWTIDREPFSSCIAKNSNIDIDIKWENLSNLKFLLRLLLWPATVFPIIPFIIIVAKLDKRVLRTTFQLNIKQDEKGEEKI